MKKTVPELLRDAAKTYEERRELYGDNYKYYGDVMRGLFPHGIIISSAEDWNRLGLLHNIVTKITRYAQTLKRGGHKDSAHDASVYSAMLEEMTASTTWTEKRSESGGRRVENIANLNRIERRSSTRRECDRE